MRYEEFIPLCFAVNYVESQVKMCEEYTFDNIMKAQEILFNSIGALEFIINNDLMKVIARQWAKQ